MIHISKEARAQMEADMAEHERYALAMRSAVCEELRQEVRVRMLAFAKRHSKSAREIKQRLETYQRIQEMA